MNRGARVYGADSFWWWFLTLFSSFLSGCIRAADEAEHLFFFLAESRVVRVASFCSAYLVKWCCPFFFTFRLFLLTSLSTRVGVSVWCGRLISIFRVHFNCFRHFCTPLGVLLFFSRLAVFFWLAAAVSMYRWTWGIVSCAPSNWNCFFFPCYHCPVDTVSRLVISPSEADPLSFAVETWYGVAEHRRKSGVAWRKPQTVWNSIYISFSLSRFIIIIIFLSTRWGRRFMQFVVN